MLTYALVVSGPFLLIFTPVHYQTMLTYALFTPRPLLIFTPLNYQTMLTNALLVPGPFLLIFTHLNYQTILTYDLLAPLPFFVNIHPCKFPNNVGLCFTCTGSLFG